jgi:hypothetical protein
MEKYIPDKVVGEGTYGVVYHAIEKVGLWFTGDGATTRTRLLTVLSRRVPTTTSPSKSSRPLAVRTRLLRYTSLASPP